MNPGVEDLPEPGNKKEGWPWTRGSEELPAKMPDESPWPKITIVTPSYCQGQFLEETIRSVLLQGYPNLEYIVIDGGSRDNSVEIIKKYEKWLTYWESRPDRGQCHAINKGWSKAKPGIWAWLNSDDTYFPGTLAKAALALKEHPDAKLVYATVSHTDEESRHLYYYYGRPLPSGLNRLKFYRGWNIPQPTAFFYSQLVETYGGLDENFHLALDYELFIRFSKHVKFKCMDDIWATTRLHGKAKTGDWKANKVHFIKEIRIANKKNTNLLKYYYLALQEYRYNKKGILPYKWGTVIQFGKYGNAGGYKEAGWHPPEVYGTWTRGKEAKLSIPLPRVKAGSIILKVDLKAFLCQGKRECQRVNVVVNGQGICNWAVEKNRYHRQAAVIPGRFIKNHRAEIKFVLPDALSPSEAGVNEDKRMLGVNVRALELVPGDSLPGIVFIREKFDWMGTHSAYDPLCNHVGANQGYRTYSVYRKFKPLPASWKTSLYRFVHSRVDPNPFYNIASLKAEVSAFRKSRKNHVDLLHVMYGENNYAVLGRLKRFMPAKLAVTFHQTPEWWEENHKKKRLLSLIDVIMVVSKTQKSYFEQFLPGRVFWVPLGIDTAFFVPGCGIEKNAKDPKIVFSGHWMRDIKTLQAVVGNLLNHNPGITFDFLVPESRRQDEHFRELEKLPQIRWHAGLPDKKLREIYQTASLLFIPYLNCTASCALLESMACGLPVVTSRVGGIPDYTDPSFADLLPVGDVNGFTRSIIDLLENPCKLKQRSLLARKYAEDNFSWPVIAGKTTEIYKNILAEK